ncbi:oxidoreductase [Halobaculum litoreum]|uniref:oxidoreductase n=1 Tax=Halobaculum litoreum TaxID=3031998 RepID=UPI0024C2F7AA|nr:oxidoreductase [Halobaculum sp. DT92]
MTGWTAADLPDMDGERVVVTGANSGIGKEATRAFARAGAEVTLACRSVERGEAAAAGIERAESGVSGDDLTVAELDLADLSSVRAFADERDDPIDVLCNNAGVMAIPRTETVDGFETQFGVNHLGHFALTGLLLDDLVAADGESRVVTQSSRAHERGEIDFDDLHHERAYGKWEAYGQSKLANVLFGYELQRRLDGHGVDGVTSVVCHPGWAATNLQRRGPEAEGSQFRALAMRAANAVFAQSAAAGAWPLLYAATAPGVAGGDYVGPGGLFDMRGHPERQRSSDRSYREGDAERLWNVSEELTGVTYEFGTAGDGDGDAGAAADADVDADD